MPSRRAVALVLALTVMGLSATACGGNGGEPGSAGSIGPVEAAAGHFTIPSGVEQVETPHGLVAVSGAIGAKYADLGGRRGELGMPTGGEQDAPHGGRYQEFDGGVVYWSDRTGAHVVWGEIRNAWEQHGGAGGSFGYPTGDEHDVTGGKEATFAGGRITWIDDQTSMYPN